MVFFSTTTYLDTGWAGSCCCIAQETETSQILHPYSILLSWICFTDNCQILHMGRPSRYSKFGLTTQLWDGSTCWGNDPTEQLLHTWQTETHFLHPILTKSCDRAGGYLYRQWSTAFNCTFNAGSITFLDLWCLILVFWQLLSNSY